MKSAIYESTRDKTPELYISWNKHNRCTPHFHQQIEILVMLQGTAEVTINDRQHTLSTNQVAIADSFDIHSYHHSLESLSGVILIPRRFLNNYQTYKRERVLSDNFIYDTSVGEFISTTIPTLTADQSNRLLINGIIDSILGKILTKIPLIESNSNPNLDLIREILIFINNNITEELTLERVAQEFGYSKHYFSRIFNRYTNNKFKDYINNARLAKALSLINAKGQKPIDAAFNSGFKSIQTFYRCFKARFGTSPANASDILSNIHI